MDIKLWADDEIKIDPENNILKVGVISECHVS